MSFPRGWKATVTKPTVVPADGTMEMGPAGKQPKDTLFLHVQKSNGIYAELRKSDSASSMFKRSQKDDRLSWQHLPSIESYHLKFANGYTPVLIGKHKACVQMWENNAGEDEIIDVLQIDIQESDGKIYRFLGNAQHNGPVTGRGERDTDGVSMPDRPVPEMSASLPIFESMAKSIKIGK